MPRALLSILIFLTSATALAAPPDTDHDGLPDALEQTLLEQFSPTFFIGAHDCSVRPAAFHSNTLQPTPQREDGTIYGQAFPSPSSTPSAPEVELHFYHLWSRDCGEHGHPLDAEHVAVLLRPSTTSLDSAQWHALYWYAAAHEHTVCDVSQIARASSLRATDHGAAVWISPDKHASYLNEALCHRGCGADRCQAMVPLASAAVVNLGEPGHPMNQAAFAHSSAWPLESKMRTTNFPARALTRLNTLPESDIAWFNPGRHPSQGIIAISASTESALATSGNNTAAALNTAGDSTAAALGAAGDSTDNALEKTYRKTTHALGASLRNTCKALHLAPNQPTVR